MPTIIVTRETTWEDFEAGVAEAQELIQRIGVPSPIEKTREDLLARFAQKEGLSVADAEALLRSNGAPPIPVEPEPELDPEEQAAKAAAAVESLRTRQTASGGRPYFYVDPKNLAFLQMMTTMRMEASVVANVLFTGPTGCGKTTLAQEVGSTMGIPVHIVNCPSITTDEKWVGHKEFRDGKTEYVLSEMLRWISTPGWKIVVFDELTRLHPTRHNILFPLLDQQQNIWVPELDIHVQVQDTLFWATANMGVGYTGTHKLDAALNGRFGYRLELDFPDKDQEVEILVQRTGIERPQAALLVDIAMLTRTKHRQGDLEESVSTRNLLDAAALVAAGMGIRDAAEYTFVKFYSEEGGASSHRAIVRQILNGKVPVGK